MSYEQRIRRRSELEAKIFADQWDKKLLEALLDKEAKQRVAQMACRAIGYHVAREVQHAAWVRHGTSI